MSQEKRETSSTRLRVTPWRSPRIAINATAGQSVAPTPTIKTTGAATPILDRTVQTAMQVVVAKTQARVPAHRIADVTTPAHRIVDRTIDVATLNRLKTDATKPVRRAVNPIAGLTVAVHRRVDRMIDVVMRNRRKADVRTLARPVGSPIAGQITLAPRLVDLMIGDATSSRRNVEEVSSVRRAVVLVRRNMVPAATAVDSFPHIAAVTIVDTAVSARPSVDLITVEVA